jgi:hypothetical protein
VYLARHPTPTACAAASEHRYPSPARYKPGPRQLHHHRRYQPCESSNQVVVRPPRRRHPHRVASPATSCSPRPPSASRPAGRGSGFPGPLRSVTSTRTVLSQALTATVTVSSAAAEPLCRTLLLKSSPAKLRHPRTGARGRAPRRRTRGRPAPAPPARQASRSPGPPAQPSAHPPSRPAPPREITRAAGRTQRDARSTRRQTSSQGRPRNGHRNPVKRLPTPLPGTDSRPLCVRGHRNATPYSATR